MPMAAQPTAEDTGTPYANFAFQVSIEKTSKPGGGKDDQAASSWKSGLIGGFSEISGLEAMMEHKVIRVGGRNHAPQLRAGPVSFGTVVLKRGILEAQILWHWWAMFAGADGEAGRPSPENRAHILIGLIRQSATPDDRKIRLGWRLRNAMPIKFRVGDLNAKGSDVAIEELHLAHEGLEMKGVVA